MLEKWHIASQGNAYNCHISQGFHSKKLDRWMVNFDFLTVFKLNV